MTGVLSGNSAKGEVKSRLRSTARAIQFGFCMVESLVVVFEVTMVRSSCYDPA